MGDFSVNITCMRDDLHFSAYETENCVGEQEDFSVPWETCVVYPPMPWTYVIAHEGHAPDALLPSRHKGRHKLRHKYGDGNETGSSASGLKAYGAVALLLLNVAGAILV